jgi:hypothetical protein
MRKSHHGRPPAPAADVPAPPIAGAAPTGEALSLGASATGLSEGVGAGDVTASGVELGDGLGPGGTGLTTTVDGVARGVGFAVGVGPGAAPRAWPELASTISDDSSTASNCDAGTLLSCWITV